MLCGCIMFACSGQAACCVAAVGDRWHYGPQWGSKRMPVVGVNCKDRCKFLLDEVTVCITVWGLIMLVFIELLLLVCVCWSVSVTLQWLGVVWHNTDCIILSWWVWFESTHWFNNLFLHHLSFIFVNLSTFSWSYDSLNGVIVAPEWCRISKSDIDI